MRCDHIICVPFPWVAIDQTTPETVESFFLYVCYCILNFCWGGGQGLCQRSFWWALNKNVLALNPLRSIICEISKFTARRSRHCGCGYCCCCQNWCIRGSRNLEYLYGICVSITVGGGDVCWGSMMYVGLAPVFWVCNGRGYVYPQMFEILYSLLVFLDRTQHEFYVSQNHLNDDCNVPREDILGDRECRL